MVNTVYIQIFIIKIDKAPARCTYQNLCFEYLSCLRFTHCQNLIGPIGYLWLWLMIEKTSVNTAFFAHTVTFSEYLLDRNASIDNSNVNMVKEINQSA